MSTSIAIIGASGGIGQAFTRLLANDTTHQIYAFSRSGMSIDAPNIHHHTIDIENEDSITQAVAALPEEHAFDQVIVTTGLLHDDALMPEKSIKELNANSFAKLFAINATGPALVAKHFLPKLASDKRAIFAAISACVGSISDNYLGGWYAYRSSKAALNMIIKNLAIEHGRKHKHAIIVGLHPGTVDTSLSQPFQRNVPDEKLFTPEQSATYLLKVLSCCTNADSGKCFAWDGQEIAP